MLCGDAPSRGSTAALAGIGDGLQKGGNAWTERRGDERGHAERRERWGVIRWLFHIRGHLGGGRARREAIDKRDDLTSDVDGVTHVHV